MDTQPDDPGLCCNLELKARLAAAVTAHLVARELSTGEPRREFQLDTYFFCPQGRLKLRQIDKKHGQLVWYQRADQASARESHYQLAEITAVEAVCQLLSTALGVRARVQKQRTIYWYENVRIHLDEVVTLGDFLEFEAVITSSREREKAPEQLEYLSEAFGIRATDVLTMSYGEMVGVDGELLE